VAFTESGNTVTHYIDGRPVGSAVLGANGGGIFNMANCMDQQQPVFVGGRGDFYEYNAEHLSGDISELFVVGSVVSTNDLASMDAYLMARHNIILPNPNPTNLVVSIGSGEQITLSWPMDHTGWLLQSNSVGLADSGAWANIAGSTATQTNVFYRMLYQSY